jgi:hypothetical protein
MRGRSGIAALASDVNSEQDLRRIAPPAVEIFARPGGGSGSVFTDCRRGGAPL